MPLLKKLISLGKTSKAVVIPNDWLDYYEKQGISTKLVVMEIDNVITIRVPRDNEAANLSIASDQEGQL